MDEKFKNLPLRIGVGIVLLNKDKGIEESGVVEQLLEEKKSLYEFFKKQMA